MLGAIYEIPSWGSITLIELIWILIGVVQCAFCLLHMRALTEDWMVATRQDRPVLREIAWGYLRREIMRFLSGLAIVGLGIYTALEPNPLPGPAFITPTGIFISVILFFIAFTSAIQSVLDWRTRHLVQQLIIKGGNGSNDH